MSWAAVVSGKVHAAEAPPRRAPIVIHPTPPTTPPASQTQPNANDKPQSPPRRPSRPHQTTSPSNTNTNTNPRRKPSKQSTTTSSSSMWDDPRIVSIYRLWTHHISSFMANPRPFFHFFVVDINFRQSVFDAGLTFHPDTDPAHPILLNLNSARFGMADRISALSPPTLPDAPPSPSAPLPPSPRPDLPPPPPPPPFLFDPAPDPIQQHHLLALNFHDTLRIDQSDTESERTSDPDQHPKNSTSVQKAHLTYPERRRAGRRRVVSRVLDIRIPSNPACAQLSDRAKAELVHQIEETFPAITPPPGFSAIREDLLKRLRTIISAEWDGAGIDVYGSAGNGLGLRSADVDMSLYMPHSVAAAHGREKGKPDAPKVILGRLAEIMQENNMVVLRKVLEARVPVIKMQDPVSKLQVDVCVNNTLAVRNTELLKAYVDLDERFRYVCVLVKRWAKRRDLNDAYHGTLSSYAYTLLVIHYLQTLPTPILPCLQQMVGGKRLPRPSKLPKEMTDNGNHKLYNTYYDRTVTRETFESNNHTPVHELLLGFFRYYAYTFRYRTDLVSIRMGTKASRACRNWDEQTVYREWESKQAQYKSAFDAAKTALQARKKADAEERKLREAQQANGGSGSSKVNSVKPNAKRERIQFPQRPRLESKHLFCIEDPFDIDHDLSRGMEKGAVTVIRQEMMRAYEIIAETGDFESACEEWV